MKTHPENPARKTARPAPPVPALPEKRAVPTTLTMTPETHRRLLEIAALEHRSFANLIMTIVERYLDQETKP